MSTKFTEENLDSLPPEAMKIIILNMQKQIEDLTQQVSLLVEQMKISNRQRYGTKSEATVYQPQLDLEFNEAEEHSDSGMPEPSDVEQIVPSYKRRVKTKGKKDEDLSKITDIREEKLEISEEELRDIFKDGYKRLPDEVYRKLEYHPAGFEVVEYHVSVYAGKDNQTIVKAKRPAELLRNSIATASLIAGIMNAKYTNALPLYRQEQGFSEINVNISRQTMANWIIRTSERYFSLLYERYKEELKKHHLIHADETPVEVTKDGRSTGTKSYMWVYRSAEAEEHPVILYDYRKTRSSEHPMEYLEGFRGVLVCDGYQAYHRLGKENTEITVANCWVHARRRFANIVKAMGRKGAKGSLAEAAVSQIAAIYHLDNQVAEMDSSEQLENRQKLIGPLVDTFFSWIRANQYKVAEKSETGKGFTYCLNQEKYLREFLNDASIPLDNNAAERANRPFTIGRKNWVMIDTISGAESSAMVYSIVQTAKANKLKTYEYLEYLLEEIPRHMDDRNLDFLEDLLPWSEKIPSKIRKN